jgi:hypothetical protein
MNNSFNAVDPEDIPSFVNLNVPSILDACMPSNWCVASTGVEAQDVALGTAFANEAISYARRVGNNNCIVFAIAEIGRRGHFGWIEIAFLDRLAFAARAGVMN